KHRPVPKLSSFTAISVFFHFLPKGKIDRRAAVTLFNSGEIRKQPGRRFLNASPGCLTGNRSKRRPSALESIQAGAKVDVIWLPVQAKRRRGVDSGCFGLGYPVARFPRVYDFYVVALIIEGAGYVLFGFYAGRTP